MMKGKVKRTLGIVNGLFLDEEDNFVHVGSDKKLLIKVSTEKCALVYIHHLNQWTDGQEKKTEALFSRS